MRLATLSFALLASLLAGTVHAQSVGSYPNRPVILSFLLRPEGTPILAEGSSPTRFPAAWGNLSSSRIGVALAG
jgi:hypothetical protein